MATTCTAPDWCDTCKGHGIVSVPNPDGSETAVLRRCPGTTHDDRIAALVQRLREVDNTTGIVTPVRLMELCHEAAAELAAAHDERMELRFLCAVHGVETA